MKVMGEVLYMILSFIAGLLLGTLFFGGLWFTVKKIVNTRTPAIWFFSSFIFRMGITLLGFYGIARNNWYSLLVCVGGFIVARFVIIYFTKSIDEKKIQLKREDSYEA
jgi:F1F0 ATPase subunit 2